MILNKSNSQSTLQSPPLYIWWNVVVTVNIKQKSERQSRLYSEYYSVSLMNTLACEWLYDTGSWTQTQRTINDNKTQQSGSIVFVTDTFLPVRPLWLRPCSPAWTLYSSNSLTQFVLMSKNIAENVTADDQICFLFQDEDDSRTVMNFSNEAFGSLNSAPYSHSSEVIGYIRWVLIAEKS